jgi:LPS-assembly protein
MSRLSQGLRLFVLLASMLLMEAAPATGQLVSPDVPIQFSADEVSYDRDHGIVTARGNVEISQNNAVLRADTVTYNQRQDVMTASGNVSLLEPDGNVGFAEYMELTGDFKQGVIRDLKAILSDTSRIAANGARRTDGNTTTMSRAVYSPCDLCKDDPSRPPLWQVKALQVVHDKADQTIEYKDAWLEIAGWPVAYTPYLSHPDPTVKRRSGFLAPRFGGSSNLGFSVEQPYYWVVSPQTDATIVPRYTSKEGPILFSEYRQRYRSGFIDANASITEDSKDDARGHVKAKTRTGINETWRWGLDVDRSTDGTYLRRYGYGNENDTLTSRLFTEGFRGGNYASANSYVFQGLRQDDQRGQIPVVLPMLTYSQFGDPDRLGGRTHTEASVLALTRTDGMDTRRLSVVSGWERPWLTESGHMFEVSTSLWGQAYDLNRAVRPDGSEYTGAAARLVPEGALSWGYPLVQNQGNVTQMVEPLASFVVSPYGGNPSRIPNEDSQDIEFDDTNLFSSNRFTGVDRVEGGPRFNYGVRWGVFGDKGGSTTALFGQVFRPKTDDTFPDGSGLEDKLSDFVGRLTVQPVANWNLSYRGRWDKDNLENRRSELFTSLGPRPLNLTVGYIQFDRQDQSELPGREEIQGSISAQITRYWTTRLSAVRDLNEDGGLRSIQGYLTYEDECFAITTRIARSFYEDRDLKPDDSIVVQLVFKTLGDIQTSLY